MFSLKRQPEKKKSQTKEIVNKDIDTEKVKKPIPAKTEIKQAKPKKTNEVSGIYAKGYRMLGKKIEFMLPKLAALENKLEKAGKPIPFEVYVAGIVLMSAIGGIVGVAIGIVFSLLINIHPVEFGYVLPFFTGVAAFQMTFGILYIAPGFSIGARRKKFAEELPYFMGYMATLASSGLTLEGIFKAIAKEQTKEEVVLAARYVVRNIDVFGMDIITAIVDLIRRSPSESFTELLEGLISTVQTGGNLKQYFTATAKVHMEEKKLMLKRMTESLGIVSEMYTILLVVFPLMATIMFSIMAIMSPGGGFMGMDITMIMKLITYLLVPIFGMMVLMMMDGMVPKR